MMQSRCYCANYPFPHVAGSLRMCAVRLEADGVEPTEAEIRDYEACLCTPRSASC